jgi:hypothetical protein
MLEKDGHRPFLRIYIYRTADVSFSQKVCYKHTHPNPYQYWESHLHPAIRQAIFSIGIQGWNLMSVGVLNVPVLE